MTIVSSDDEPLALGRANVLVLNPFKIIDIH
jgi:hypothetical protein